MALWLCVLFALIGGEVPAIKNVGQRVVSLIAACYLVGVLLVWVVPHLFAPTAIRRRVLDGGALRTYGRAGADLSDQDRSAQAGRPLYSVDLVYSLLLFLMIVVLVLGAFVMREVSHGDYVVSLAKALLVIGGILVAVSWLWDPRAGFAGIGQLLTRYFLSVGMPFERWMHALGESRRPGARSRPFRVDRASKKWRLSPGSRASTGKPRTARGMAGRLSRHGTPYTFGGLCRDALYALVSEPGAGRAHAAAGAPAGRLLRNQAARAGAAAERIPARDLRNRLAPDARREESAAVLEFLVRGRGKQRRSAMLWLCASWCSGNCRRSRNGCKAPWTS